MSGQRKRALITGISGFVGRHLSALLLDRGFEVWGIDRNAAAIEGAQVTAGDMLATALVDRVVKEVGPDYIFHLAGQSSPKESLARPIETMRTNVITQLNLHEAVRRAGLDPVIQIAGSCEQYGRLEPADLPAKETTAFRPLSPYSYSKVAQELLAKKYFKDYGQRTVVTRAFHHTGPGHDESFVCSNFAKQVAKIELGINPEPVVHVGNLEARRDYSDVRDIVNAYLLAAEKCAPGAAYNVCSGEAISIREILETMIALSIRPITIKEDPDRLRKNDTMTVVGDTAKFRDATGWQPQITIKQTLEDLLNYWRAELKKQL